MHRHEFLASAAPLFVTAHVLGLGGKPGANNTLRIAFIGMGGRARWMIRNEKFPGARIASVADCYLPRCFEAAR